MKKILFVFALLLTVGHANAQTEAELTLNTRAWSTNYFATTLYGVAETAVKHLAFKGHEKDSLWAERILPDPDLVFPIGMTKKGFHGDREIYHPYHRAFANPFKKLGDWGIGADVSYKPSFFGAYAGLYYKSQEIVFKATKDNLRGYYVQPRVGMVFGHEEYGFEAGVFYDKALHGGGSLLGANKHMLKGGWGLDFALSIKEQSDNSKFLLQFSMPMHNFLNKGYPGMEGLKRKVGYIMITQRVLLK